MAGCELRRDNRPSILVIAVENLSFDSVSCDSEEVSPGFETFCNEGIRFTHAFTPSTMSQAALASVLTGMYPARHLVRDNGNDHLAAKFRTVAEAAVEKGYRTMFVSGGPPIFRKSGLSQGFEVFDDNLDLNFGHYYRAVYDVFGIFGDWLTKEANATPYLAMLYLADLQFAEIPTFTQDGEQRERTAESQLQEIGESLQSLIEQLKAKRHWDSTHVILMGLSGGMEPTELKSGNTQVTLFIKPARSPRDSGSHWTIDRNVSLVDVGQTMFSILGEPLEPMDNDVLEKVSLQSVFSIPEPDWRDDRIIYSESGWTRWRLGSEIRVALRQKQFLYINDSKPLIFNSLADHMENTPISERDPLWTSISGPINAALDKVSPERMRPASSGHLFDVGRSLWVHNELSENLESELNEIYQHREKDPVLSGWWARWALEREDWATLAKLGQAAKKPLWAYVGESHSSFPAQTLPDSIECASLFRGSPAPKNCNDELILSINRWMQEKNEEDKTQKRDRVLRLYTQERINDRVGQLHFINSAKWDVKLEYPRPPILTDLFLALPRNRAFSTQINNLLRPKDLSL